MERDGNYCNPGNAMRAAVSTRSAGCLCQIVDAARRISRKRDGNAVIRCGACRARSLLDWESNCKKVPVCVCVRAGYYVYYSMQILIFPLVCVSAVWVRKLRRTRTHQRRIKRLFTP
jgi:hypothetical protein